MNSVRSTRVRLTRKLANLLNGIDLSGFSVGDHLDLPPRDAWLLIAEGWAVACDEPQPGRAERDRRIRAAHEPFTGGCRSRDAACSRAPAIDRQHVTDKRSSDSDRAFSPIRVAVGDKEYGSRDDLMWVRRQLADRILTTSHPPSDTKNASWTHRFHSILESLATDPAISAAIVAEKMNLSPWHFSRLLRQRTQMGFRMHLSRTRLRIAGRLLRDSALSIKEVSARAGFTSASELNHHFRRTFRMTPTQFRTHSDNSFEQPPESQTLASISKNYQAS